MKKKDKEKYGSFNKDIEGERNLRDILVVEIIGFKYLYMKD